MMLHNITLLTNFIISILYFYSIYSCSLELYFYKSILIKNIIIVRYKINISAYFIFNTYYYIIFFNEKAHLVKKKSWMLHRLVFVI